MSRVLVTGLSGFAGQHLARLLVQRGFEVAGTVLTAPPERLRSLIGRAGGDDRLAVADVTDLNALTKVVADVRPDGVFHLAGLADVPASDADPLRAFRINALGAVNLLAAVAACDRPCRIVLVSSASVYGPLTADMIPVREHAPIRPISPYGASKAAAELMARQWGRPGMEVVCVRPFNHAGPGQQPGFFCPDVARQLVAIERGRQAPTIAVGNLDAVRDFSDVRDMVAGYLAAWEHGRNGAIYNICSGVGRSVREVMDTLIELSGLQVRVEVAADRMRSIDISTVVGSADALRAVSGWEPRVPWRQTLVDVLEDWRRRKT